MSTGALPGAAAVTAGHGLLYGVPVAGTRFYFQRHHNPLSVRVCLSAFLGRLPGPWVEA